MNLSFKNLKELFATFSDETICREYLEEQLWSGKPKCPYCSYTKKIYKLSNGKQYKCGNKECHKKFTVTVGTIFESSHIKLSTWFAAMYLVTAHKKGISSSQLSRDLGVTQKTAWFMLHRIREMLKEEAPTMLKESVQADETYVSGKNKNRHKDKKTENSQGRSSKDKTPVVGLIEDEGKVIAFVVKDTSSETLHSIVQKNVEKQSTLVTDAYSSYKGLEQYFTHVVVKHQNGEYIVNDKFHTNNIENFWSQLKRGIVGIYHFISPKHLQRYCDEFGYRYNTRKISDSDRFIISLNKCDNKRLKYKDLIAKNNVQNYPVIG